MMTNTTTHHTPVKTYLMVFGCLALLTAVTVVLSYAGLSMKVAIVAASAIALAKGVLIMTFFMHLRAEPKAIYFIFFTAVALVLFLGFYLLPDIAFTH